MAVFFIALGLALLGLICYAGYSDLKARKRGQVIVPVKNGFGRRTTFISMDKKELEEQKLAAAYLEQERQRSERARLADGAMQTIKPFGGIFGATTRRMRGR